MTWDPRSSTARLVFISMGLLALASAQVPPPGQDSKAPPAQPGQLGPAGASAQRDNKAGDQNTNGNGESTATVPGDTGDYKLEGVTVRNVLVPTTVLDPDGHGYVNGITAKEFTVLDNGKEQKIASEVTEQPVSVVLAVQANSEVEPLLPVMRKSGLLLQGLVTGQDGDAAILAFDHRMQVMQDFTNDPSKLDDAMQKLTAGSSTSAIIDAVVQADHMLLLHDRQNTRRRVIILMSRDVNKGSEANLEETIHRIQFHNVIIYCVDISKFKTALLKKAPYPRPQNGGQPASAQPSIIGQTPSDTNVIQQQNGNVLDAAPPIFAVFATCLRRARLKRSLTSLEGIFTASRIRKDSKRLLLTLAKT